MDPLVRCLCTCEELIHEGESQLIFPSVNKGAQNWNLQYIPRSECFSEKDKDVPDLYLNCSSIYERYWRDHDFLRCLVLCQCANCHRFLRSMNQVLSHLFVRMVYYVYHRFLHHDLIFAIIFTSFPHPLRKLLPPPHDVHKPHPLPILQEPKRIANHTAITLPLKRSLSWRPPII